MQLVEIEQALLRLERDESAATLNDYALLLKQCARHKSLRHGKLVHRSISKSSHHLSSGGRFLRNLIMEMYGKCGSSDDALSVFRTIDKPNAFSYTMLMLGYGQNGREKEAFHAFKCMDLDGVFPHEVTYMNALALCSRLGDARHATALHSCLDGTGLESSLVLQTAVCSMYTGCSRLDLAEIVFENMTERSAITWNAMLSAYVKNARGRDGRRLFWRMEAEGVKPDSVTFLLVVEVHEILGDLDQIARVQQRTHEMGYDGQISVQTTFLNFYGKHGNIQGARRIFDGLENRNSVCWNSMIGTYAQHGMGRHAVELYLKMKSENVVKPDEVTFINVLSGCASLGELAVGRTVHEDILHHGMEKDVVVLNSLLNMYGRCGSLEYAREVFDKMKDKIGSSWTVMITQYAEHGRGFVALDLFMDMHVEGFQPEDITFVTVLSVCSHLGLLKEGRDFFFSLNRDHGIHYMTEHYGCMVDLLARAGMLELAEEYLERVPSRLTPVAWTALLTSCRVHGDVERGTRAAARMFEIDPEDSGTYSILKQLFTNAGRWDDLAALTEAMEARGIRLKNSSIEEELLD